MQGHISQAALDTSDISSVQVGLFGQALLRPAPACAEVADAIGERVDGQICEFLVLGAQSS
jgi:hypothetical protein